MFRACTAQRLLLSCVVIAALSAPLTARAITPTPSATPIPPSSCVGDCDASGDVFVNEIIAIVDWALSGEPSGTCPAVVQWCSEGPPVFITCVVQAVNNAFYGCSGLPTPTPSPAVSLALQLDHTPGAVHIAARLTNMTDAPIFYLGGCSALCRPLMYRAVSFRVTGPNAAEVIVKSNEYYPCSFPLLCAEFPQQISAGEFLEEALDIDGTAWKVNMGSGGECGVCTTQPFAAGRYTVTATSSYSTDPNAVYRPTGHVQGAVEFDWP